MYDFSAEYAECCCPAPEQCLLLALLLVPQHASFGTCYFEIVTLLTQQYTIKTQTEGSNFRQGYLSWEAQKRFSNTNQAQTPTNL
jgi:hypothetical protein